MVIRARLKKSGNNFVSPANAFAKSKPKPSARCATQPASANSTASSKSSKSSSSQLPASHPALVPFFLAAECACSRGTIAHLLKADLQERHIVFKLTIRSQTLKCLTRIKEYPLRYAT